MFAEPLGKTSSLPANMALSPRASVLLQGVLNCCLDSLGPVLMDTLAALEQELFQLAACAPSTQQQVELYVDMKRLRDRKESFIPCFCEGLVRAFGALNMPCEQMTAAALPLAENSEIDRDIVLHDIAGRSVVRHLDALQMLGQRLAVLVAMPAFQPERMPMGPQLLCRILRECGETLGLNPNTQVTLYRVFESKSMDRYGHLLECANRLLDQAGILPRLVSLPEAARSVLPRPHDLPGNPADTVMCSTEWCNATLAPRCTPVTAQGVNVAQLPAVPQCSTITNGTGVDSDVGTDTTFPSVAPDLSQMSDVLQTRMSTLFLPSGAGGETVLCPPGVQLNGQFAVMPSAFPGYKMKMSQVFTFPSDTEIKSNKSSDAPQARTLTPFSASYLSGMDLNQLLSALQGRIAATSPRGGAWRSVRELRQHVLVNIRARYGVAAVLSAQDEHVFELIDMLYSEIEREVRGSSTVADLLTRLQVPVLRAALRDPRFFVRDQHPARELLNVIAESASTWLGDEELDPQLLQLLNSAVDKVLHEYQGEEAVFVQAYQDIQVGYCAQVHRVAVTERHYIEAARDQERLALAKRQATETIELLCAVAPPPRFVKTLLRQAWLDVLTLSVLRQGKESPEWQEHEALTERICAITSTPAGGASDLVLREQVEQSLYHVGYGNIEASAIARRLSTPDGEDELMSRTELAARLKHHTRFGEQIEPRPLQETILPRNTVEETCYAQLRTLPFGTWLEFVMNQQGDVRRQRLCWYSPVTDHVLLVNPRGQKSTEHTLDTLARLLANGQLRIFTEEEGRLIDRAWSATLRALRHLLGARDTFENLHA